MVLNERSLPQSEVIRAVSLEDGPRRLAALRGDQGLNVGLQSIFAVHICSAYLGGYLQPAAQHALVVRGRHLLQAPRVCQLTAAVGVLNRGYSCRREALNRRGCSCRPRRLPTCSSSAPPSVQDSAKHCSMASLVNQARSTWREARATTRGEYGHLMRRERVVPQFEVIRAI